MGKCIHRCLPVLPVLPLRDVGKQTACLVKGENGVYDRLRRVRNEYIALLLALAVVMDGPALNRCIERGSLLTAIHIHEALHLLVVDGWSKARIVRSTHPARQRGGHSTQNG